MSERDRYRPTYQPYDPEGSPFVAHETEGMPFSRKSEEMRVIKRFLARQKDRERIKQSAE